MRILYYLCTKKQKRRKLKQNKTVGPAYGSKSLFEFHGLPGKFKESLKILDIHNLIIEGVFQISVFWKKNYFT